MTAPLADASTLVESIRAFLGDPGAELVRREPNAYTTTFPSEIVHFRRQDGDAVTLFCKYASGGSVGSHGHRHGVDYEAYIYDGLLARGELSTPRLYGFWNEGGSARGCLVMEFMEDALPISKMSYAVSLERAAEWIADFHAVGARCLAESPLDRIDRYDRDYYLGWVERTRARAAREGLDEAWLDSFLDRFERSLDMMLDTELVPIHGEFYPHNVLVHDGEIRPIDWESVAFAPGEIDLASLTENWGDEVEEACADAYARTRWPHGAPAEFRHRLELARAYLQLRWLGAKPGGSVAAAGWRFEELREIAERTEVRAFS